MPTYTFRLPARFASTPVTVYNTADVQQTTGTTDSNALFVASLPTGDYYAKISYGYTSYKAAGEVDRGDLDNISEAAMSAAPAYAGPRSKGRSDTAHSSYNVKASNVRRTRAGLGKVQGTPTALTRITPIGDSLTAGQGATTISTQAWPAILRGALGARGFTSAGTGFVYATNASASWLDSRWTRGSWITTGNGTRNYFMRSTAAAQAITFTSDVPGTVVEILTYGSSPVFTVAIDSVTQAAWTPSGSLVPQVITYSGLANTTHTVTLTSISANNYVVACNVRQTTGLVVSNPGLCGSTTADWADLTAWYPAKTALATSPDIVPIMLGTNDGLTAVSPSAYKASLSAVVAAVQAANAEPFLITPVGWSTSGNPGGYAAITQAAQQAIVSAAYDVADSADIPLLDMMDVVGDYTTGNNLGEYNDGVHLSSVGYSVVGQAVARMLAA